MDPIFEKILNRFGIVQETIEQARQRQATQGGSLRQNLIALNVFTEETFAESVSAQLRVPYINLEKIIIADDVLALLPREKAEKYLALPLELDDRHRRLNIILANPSDMSAIDELKFVIGYTLIPHYTPEDELFEAIRREYSRFEEKQAIATAVTDQLSTPTDIQSNLIDIASLTTAEQAISQLIGAIFTVAYSKQASEIHIEPNFDSIRIRLRIDRKISEIARFPKRLTSLLISRMKRVLGLDVGEHACLSPKGCATVKLENKKELDISYQVYPTAQSEHVLIKMKDRYTLHGLEDLDLEPKAQNDLQKVLGSPQGVVLATGTAKSGLTTTLYALLKTVNTPHMSVFSVEDPIECVIEGVTQGQVYEEAGHTYKQYIQYVSKQRPDVVMIDKMVDAKLLQEVFFLSSGSLILSSLSAIDTASAAMKLVLMSTPELVVDRVNCITAQRLVRKICDLCKEELVLSETHREKLGLLPEDHCYSGKGCEHCGHTGYKGLTSIFEVMLFTEDVKQMIIDSCTPNDLRELIASKNVLSLRDDGMRKVKQGLTTVQEVLKATML
jgi:type IV pilus assembly protein PilB